MEVTHQERAIWTVGHSNHDWADFLETLGSESIETLADGRRFPGSRRLPQFGRDAMKRALAEEGIEYLHFEGLGGRRGTPSPDSPNGAWRVASFNAYADYMLTPEFHAALEELQRVAECTRTTIMCAEAAPWRCHRRLISDALVARNWKVIDIFGRERTKRHALTSFAQVQGEQVLYPAESDEP